MSLFEWLFSYLYSQLLFSFGFEYKVIEADNSNEYIARFLFSFFFLFNQLNDIEIKHLIALHLSNLVDRIFMNR